MRQQIIFIVNPHSGTWGKTNWIAMATRMLATEYDLEFKYTTHKGHAHSLAKAAAESGATTVVAVGGDGTVNEIASALVHTNTALGILPLGSGNGLARDLGISTLLPFNALETIKRKKVLNIDYGTANGTPFFCTCGIGFDAHISHLFADKSKRGFINYLRLTIREYFKYKPKEYLLKYDGKSITQKAFVINIANIQQLGNNAYIAPKADFQDGLLNVTIVHPFGFFGALRLGATLFLKQIDKVRYVETFTCSEIELVLPPNTPFHFDGEASGVSRNILIKAIPLGLKVIVP